MTGHEQAAATPLTVARALLAAGHPVGAVEAALVTAWCAAHGLAAPAGGTVHAAVTAADPTLVAAFDPVGEWTVDGVVMTFETLVPAEEAARYGAVFTPAAVTGFLVEEAVRRWQSANPDGDLRTVTVLDPAVGAGAILVAALLRLVELTGQAPHQVAARLHGVDVSAQSVTRARTLLELVCLTLGDPAVPAPQLTVADALAVEHGRRFDLVVANPPYVRYQQLDPADRTRIAELFPDVCGSGNFNLYFPFFALAHAAAAPGGQVALITPNSWLGGFAAAGLRDWLRREDLVRDIADFGHHRVFDAMTYTAVTFLAEPAPGRSGGFGYADVPGLAGLAALPADWPATRTQGYRVTNLPAGKPWRLAGPRAARVLAALSGQTPLLDVADIRYGLATNRDRLYLLDGARHPDGSYVKVHDGTAYRIEAGVTRRCVKVAGLTSDADVAATPTRILFPYRLTDDGPVILEEAELARDFPGAYAYLLAVKGDLAGRDKGAKTYPAWYAYGRSQGLVPLGTKLLTPMYAKTPRFLYDDDPDSVFVNGVAVVARHLDVDILGMVLNSAACRYYVTATSNPINGGYFAYQKSQLAGFTVPTFTGMQKAALRVARTQTERDRLIAAGYGLTPADLAVDDGAETELDAAA